MTDSLSDTPKKRRGVLTYDKNPFVGDALANTKQGVKKISGDDNNQMMIVSQNTGEIIGGAGFWQYQEVDRTQFVKLYANGVKALANLDGPGGKVFECLCFGVQKQVGKDAVYLGYASIDQTLTPMSEATYARGMRNLMEKKFIAASTSQGIFYINPDYIWNGDRLAFIKEYRLKTDKPRRSKDISTGDLFLSQQGNQHD